MTWQYNPGRGDITDPSIPREQTNMSEECYAYYGGELIAETVRSTHGPMLAEAQNMLDLLKRYISDDPCAPGDPRYYEAVAIIERIKPKPKQP